MLQRLLVWSVHRYIGGPGKSWISTSVTLLVLRLLRKSTGRRQLVDTGSIKPGQRIVIDHLNVTHKQQLGEAKRERKAVKRARRRAKREARAS